MLMKLIADLDKVQQENDCTLGYVGVMQSPQGQLVFIGGDQRISTLLGDPADADVSIPCLIFEPKAFVSAFICEDPDLRMVMNPAQLVRISQSLRARWSGPAGPRRTQRRLVVRTYIANELKDSLGTYMYNIFLNSIILNCSYTYISKFNSICHICLLHHVCYSIYIVFNMFGVFCRGAPLAAPASGGVVQVGLDDLSQRGGRSSNHVRFR